MSEEQVQNEEVEVEAAAEEEVIEEKKVDEKVICYLSKRSVPKSETVEVQYNNEGAFRVQEHLVKY